MIKLIAFILTIILMTIIARWLWNNMLVTHVSVLRPVKTLPETFLLALAISFFLKR